MGKYNLLLGEKIKFLRKKRNLTQESLAEMVCRSKNHISKIEQGNANPPVSLIFEIADVLNVKPYELFVFNKYSNAGLKNIDIKKEICSITDKNLLNILYKIMEVLKEN